MAPVTESLEVRTLGTQAGVSRIVVSPTREAIGEEETRELETLRRKFSCAGFRKGEVPVDMVRRHLGTKARSQALQKFLSQAIPKISEQCGLFPVTTPVVESVQTVNNRLDIVLSFEAAPNVDLGTYKGLPLHRKTIVITETKVTEVMGLLGLSSAQTPEDPTGESLRSFVRSALQAQAAREERRNLEDQIGDHLLRTHPFDVPPTPVRELCQEWIRQWEKEARAKGKTPTPQEREERETLALQAAERRLRLTYLLAGIAQVESIDVGTEEIVSAVKKDLSWVPAPQRDMVTKRLEARSEEVRHALWEDKIYDFLIAHAVIEDSAEKSK